MKLNDMFPSRFLKASDLKDGDVTLEIGGIEIEQLGDERKPVLNFIGKDKQMVLNKTNANTIAELYGDDTAGWRGQPITLTVERVAFQGKYVDSVRVKYQKPAATAQPAEDDGIPI